jgi:hypothetical protein
VVHGETVVVTHKFSLLDVTNRKYPPTVTQVNQKVKTISFTNHTESEMYITALLLFNIVSLQFQTLFVAVHKLHDSMEEEEFI